MLDRFHPPVEEYLEAIFSLEEEGIPVIQARLAERLDKAAPSVSEMLDRLEAEDLVVRSARQITMTPEGAALAEGVVRKHRLAERLLVDVIGLEWEKAHLEAGRWEHVISDDVERRLVELLGNPATCPHGNPIPGVGGGEADRRCLQRCLADVAAGDQVRLERITESVEHDAASLRYLSHHGLTPGATATVRDKAPDGTLTLVVGGATVAVGPAISRQLFVTVP
ncbi:MAG: metal-dependent transcriptional regulator [Actinomycetota bacterium]|jgi:DtxR family Mn-dependent transcriptional regulator|nr:metal-dependent transcriptional regulator [Actinomycetota bacterium]MDA8340985.1 metal-dependent transcriptional regulator [Actinomycetota bacterium]